jgi:glycosyltransferase involved in cell wall biosynthesis
MILGGAQENTLLTCLGLHARGHAVTLVTGPAIGAEGELLSHARAGGFNVVLLDDLRREIRPGRDWRAYRALEGTLRDLAPDVVHTHSSKAGILARRAARNLRRHRPELRIAHTIHGLPFHRYGSVPANWTYILLERQAARYTDAIISVADAMTEQALSAGVGRPEQYTTIYSGMELAPFLTRPPGADAFRQRLGLKADDVLVTQVSRLAELKGHEFILSAAGNIDRANVHFCFVGDGALRRQIEGQIAQLGLGGRVHLTGLLPQTDIPAVMHATDILVHCSLREGLARALPQGMLAGKPVVSFDVDGAREVVGSSTGVLLEPGDVAGLKLAIATLAASPALRDQLGQEGRRRASARFDHRVMVDKIEGVYNRLVTASARLK